MTSKDLRDVKKEYGYVLRWINGGGDEAGNTWPYRYFLKCTFTGNKIELDHDKFKELVTFPISEFKGPYAYERYVELFDHFSIEPMTAKSRQERYIRAVSDLTLSSIMTHSDRVNFSKGVLGKARIEQYAKDFRSKVKKAEQLLQSND